MTRRLRGMRAHPAGPMHGDVLPPPPHAGGRRRSGHGPDRYPGLACDRPPRQLRDPRVGGLSVHELVARHGTPAARARRGRLPRARRRVPGRLQRSGDPGSVFYAGKAFLSRHGRPLARRRGPRARRLHRRRARGRAARRLPGRADHAARQQQVRRRDSSAALDAGVGRIVVDSFEEIAPARRPRRAAPGGRSGCWCA